MRLGQLSRKLQIESKEIIKLLEAKGHTIEQSPNTKLDDALLEIVNAAFAPKEEVETENNEVVENTFEAEVNQPEIEEKESEAEPEVAVEAIEETEEDVVEEKDIVEEQVAITLDEAEKSEEVNSESEDSELDPENEYSFIEDNGVIRAPKVTLEGIKVVGKIDLPEKKKPEPEVEEEQAAESEAEQIEEGPKVHPNKKTRIAGVKPKTVDEKTVKVKRKQEEKPKKKVLTKEELRAKKKAQRQKKAKQKEKMLKKHGVPVAEQKKKDKTPPPAPKRSFWQKLFGLGK